LKNALYVSSRGGSFPNGNYREFPSAYPETLKKYADLQIRIFSMISAGEFNSLDKMKGKYYRVRFKILRNRIPIKGERL
jgi:hypothetical protein